VAYILHQTLIVALAFYLISGLGVTVGYHRYFTHRAFKAGRALRTALAIINRDGGNATILIRVAGGGFSAEAAVPVGTAPNGIVAADFDGNGRADFAVANSTSGTAAVFLRSASNDGFIAEPPIAVSSPPVGIDAADFNRDGRPDLAVASNAGAIEILIRSAAGGFTRDPLIPLAGAVNDVAAADFDGDGRPDLATAGRSVLLNQGDGTFAPGQSLVFYDRSDRYVVGAAVATRRPR